MKNSCFVRDPKHGTHVDVYTHIFKYMYSYTLTGVQVHTRTHSLNNYIVDLLNYVEV